MVRTILFSALTLLLLPLSVNAATPEGCGMVGALGWKSYVQDSDFAPARTYRGESLGDLAPAGTSLEQFAEEFPVKSKAAVTFQSEGNEKTITGTIAKQGYFGFTITDQAGKKFYLSSDARLFDPSSHQGPGQGDKVTSLQIEKFQGNVSQGRVPQDQLVISSFPDRVNRELRPENLIEIRPGSYVALLKRSEIESLPKGTVVTDLSGTKYLVGTDKINPSTKLALAVPPKVAEQARLVPTSAQAIFPNPASRANRTLWKLKNGDYITLLSPDELKAIPDKTVLRDIEGNKIEVGKDHIVPEARFGVTTYGLEMDPQIAGQIKERYAEQQALIRFKLTEGGKYELPKTLKGYDLSDLAPWGSTTTDFEKQFPVKSKVELHYADKEGQHAIRGTVVKHGRFGFEVKYDTGGTDYFDSDARLFLNTGEAKGDSLQVTEMVVQKATGK